MPFERREGGVPFVRRVGVVAFNILDLVELEGEKPRQVREWGTTVENAQEVKVVRFFRFDADHDLFPLPTLPCTDSTTVQYHKKTSANASRAAEEDLNLHRGSPREQSSPWRKSSRFGDFAAIIDPALCISKGLPPMNG